MNSAQQRYRAELYDRFWKYQRHQFADWVGILDRALANDGRPPVFIRDIDPAKDQTWRNMISETWVTVDRKNRVLSRVPFRERHKWFGSMSSSQALAQSVLGNLAEYGYMDALGVLQSDEGLPLLGDARVTTDSFQMEHKVSALGEPRPTSLDGYICGEYRVAIECKLSETVVGTCSRPRLKKDAAEYCDGSYPLREGGIDTCPLTRIGVAYWKYVPQLFNWNSSTGMEACPLKMNYQLVRNVLSVGVKQDGIVSTGGGHALLIYDASNPAFQEGGAGLRAYEETRNALCEPSMLRKCSWQRITDYMRGEAILPWLTDALMEKYGL